MSSLLRGASFDWIYLRLHRLSHRRSCCHTSDCTLAREKLSFDTFYIHTVRFVIEASNVIQAIGIVS